MKGEVAPVFSSPDAALVQALKANLTGISVGTRFKADSKAPQVIVSFAGGSLRNNGTSMEAAFNIRISCKEYEAVENLAYQVVGILSNYRKAPFHWIEVQSFPIFFEEDGVDLEQRLITVTARVAGL